MELNMTGREAWYKEYYHDVRKCAACPARVECTLPVPGEGNLNSPVIFLGRNPGSEEDIVGRPFVGNAGKKLMQALREVGWNREEVFITNLCLCKTMKDRFLTLPEVKICVKQFLVPTLLKLKPKVVVVFGTQPNHFIGNLDSITSHIGKYYIHKMGFAYVPSVHPAAACYNAESYDKLLVAIRLARSLVYGQKNT